MMGFAGFTKLKAYDNKGVIRDGEKGYIVLQKTKMPALLVECGYMGGDLIYCRDNYFRIAYAIFWGISRYFE